MEQDYNPIRELDAKVMAIIQNYEEKQKKIILEMSEYKKELENYSNIIRKTKSDTFEQNPSKSVINKPKGYNNELINQENKEKIKVLDSIIFQLSLNSHLEIPDALSKLQKVTLTLPRIDKFIKQISEEITLNPASRLEDVLETAKDMKKKLKELEKFKKIITENLFTINESEILEKIKGINYFCTLFEVKTNDYLIDVVEGIFYFVHEMKLFLAV